MHLYSMSTSKGKDMYDDGGGKTRKKKKCLRIRLAWLTYQISKKESGWTFCFKKIFKYQN